ncbi:MAG: response regulator [Lachnospiraceae bacterium]|nr:response regulator [Lachnospiraceae bacterium]
MECSLLLVTYEKTFLIDSVAKGLGEIGIKTAVCGPDVKDIEAGKDSADIILVFVDGFTPEMMKVLVYIKDVCVDDGKSLYLVGYKDMLDYAAEFAPPEYVEKEFPRPIDAKKLVSTLSSEAELLSRRAEQKNIMIVDDDVTYLKVIRKQLSEKYRITAVKSGMQAIKHLGAHTPDLILMDYDMPITTGSKVMEMIRSEPDTEEIPVIFLTGRADRETVMDVMGLNPQGYLLKSASGEDILASIDKFFENEKTGRKQRKHIG